MTGVKLNRKEVETKMGRAAREGVLIGTTMGMFAFISVLIFLALVKMYWLIPLPVFLFSINLYQFVKTLRSQVVPGGDSDIYFLY